ncbi:MAG: AsmA family protein [Acidobacteria bacterium]|nr:AsmA family protein [Acidobacteriota bacterium]
MKRWKRVFLWSIAIFALFLIAAAIVLPAWLDPNSYREMVESRMEETLGREVSIGEIGLKVLPVLAISVANITIQEDPPVEGAPFLEAGALRGSMKILPLLRKRFEIRRVSLEEPRIRLRRDAEGKWNFDSLLAALTTGIDPGEQAPAGEGPEFQVSRFDIRKGIISLEDWNIEPGQVTKMELTDLNLSVRDFVPGKRLRYRIDFSLPPHQGQKISSKGSLGLVPGDSGYPFEATLEVHELDPAFAGPYLSPFLDLEIDRGRFSLKVEGKGETEGPIDLTGEIHLEQLSPRLDLSFDMSISGGHDKYQFRDLQLKSAGSKFRLKGTIDISSPQTYVDLEVLPSRLLLEDLKNLLDSIDTELPVDIASPDPVEIALRLKGNPTTLREAELAGSIEVSRLTLRHPSLSSPMENVQGRVELENNHFSVRDFSGTLGSSDISGQLDLRNFDAPEVKFQLKSRQAKLGEILSFVKPGTEESAIPSSPGAETDDWQDYMEKLSATGSLEILEGSIDTLTFSRFKGTMKLEGKQIRFQPLELQIYGGTYSGSANFDMGNDPPKFRFQSRLADVDAFSLFSENLDVKELRGTLSGELDLNGRMEGYEGTLRGLKGKGTLKLEQGRIEAMNVVEMLSKVSGIFGERTLQRLSRQISQEGTDFSELTGNFLIAGGTMNIEDLALRSRDLDLVGAGTLDLLDLSLRASVQVLMSPEVSGLMRAEKSRAGEFFWNSSTNRVEFPLRLAGPVLAPTPSVDFQRASKTLVRSKVSSLLKRKLGIPERSVTTTSPPSTTEPAKLAPETPPTASSGLSVEILESRFSGNFLSPYLKLTGRFRGNDLARASLRITDTGGREILFEENAFPEIAATPAGGSTAQITFSKKVSGKALLGRGKDFLVTITLFNGRGGSSEKRVEVRR